MTETEFLKRAFKSYDNPHCVSVQEFEKDIQRFSYIKKSLTLFQRESDINERLILNHITICFNLFGNDALLFLLYKVNREHWPILFPFLIQLNRLPETVSEFSLNTSDIPLNQTIVQRLREL